jgi:AcrR family transcriptional regulator
MTHILQFDPIDDTGQSVRERQILGESNASSKNWEREQRILDATATLIVRYGYDKTSVSDIANQAGISKGAIYLHFDSKDDLLHQLILRETLKFMEIWADRMRNDTSDKVFSSMYRHVLTVMKENTFLWVLFSKQRWLLGTGFINRQGSTVYQQRLGLSKMMLTKLQAIGAIRQDLNPDTTAYVFNMLNYGYLKLGDVIPEELAPPPDETINEIGDLVQRHLEPEGDGNPDEARKIILEYLSGVAQMVKQMQDN